MSADKILSRLEDIMEAIRDAEDSVRGKSFEDYLAEPMLRSAVERKIEIISEASRHVPMELKTKYPGIPWRKVAGIGNILRHGYKLIDDHEIWDVARNELAPLKAVVESMIVEIGTPKASAPCRPSD